MPRWSPFEPYFWSKVKKTKDCWVWLGYVDSTGYGRITRNGKKQQAHRIAWELARGPIPKELLACHHCDNKICVNPDHLFLGSQKDNMQDWTRKGFNKAVVENRLSQRGDAHWKRTKEGKQYVAKWAARMKEDFLQGRRTTLRDSLGRFTGTKKV